MSARPPGLGPGAYDTRSLSPSEDSSNDISTGQQTQPACALAPTSSPRAYRRAPPPRPPPPLCALHVDGGGPTTSAGTLLLSTSNKATATPDSSRNTGSNKQLVRLTSAPHSVDSGESGHLFSPNSGVCVPSPEMNHEMCTAQSRSFSHSPSLDVTSAGESNRGTATSQMQTAASARPMSPSLELPSLTSTLTVGVNGRNALTSGATHTSSCPACTAPHVGMSL